MSGRNIELAPPPPSDDVATNEDALVRRILESIRGLRFGSVEIVVHDGRPVQIERHEKVRLDRWSS